MRRVYTYIASALEHGSRESTLPVRAEAAEPVRKSRRERGIDIFECMRELLVIHTVHGKPREWKCESTSPAQARIALERIFHSPSTFATTSRTCPHQYRRGGSGERLIVAQA